MSKGLHKFNYGLKPLLRYYDEALKANLSGVSIQNDYHFLLQLKSIQCYNTSTGKVIAFNSIPKTQIPILEKLLNIVPFVKGKAVIDFKYYINQLIKRGWLKEHTDSYNLVSINKINNNLKFSTNKKELLNKQREKINIYTYRRLQNDQGIDLQAHRIYEIICLKNKQTRHQIKVNPNATLLTSRTNYHLVDLIVKDRKNKKVTSLKNFYGISMDYLKNYGGYGSKKFIHAKLNQMQKQGLVIKKGKYDSSTDRYECNLYNCSFDGIFKTTPEIETSTDITKKAAASKKTINKTQLLFNEFLQNEENRWVMVMEGFISKSQMKKISTGNLKKIPIRSYSKLLVRLLNNEFYRPIVTNLLGNSSIKITQILKGTMLQEFGASEQRFPKLNIDVVSLVDNSTGNYKGQLLKTMDTEKKNYKDLIEIPKT